VTNVFHSSAPKISPGTFGSHLNIVVSGLCTVDSTLSPLMLIMISFWLLQYS